MPELRRNSYLKTLLIICVNLVVALAIAVGVLGYFLSVKHDKNDWQNVQIEQTCTSSSCIRSANMIMENMDDKIEPCENFYQFTCGSFDKNKRMEDDQAKINEFSILRDKVAIQVADLLSAPIGPNESYEIRSAKNLYASCMDEEKTEKRSLTTLLTLINDDFYGWPILSEEDETEKNKSIIDKMVALKKYESAQIFEVFIYLNPKDPKFNVLRLMQPDWFFNIEYLSDENFMNSYKSFITDVVMHMRPGKNENSTLQIERLIEIQTKFEMLQLPEAIRRNSTYKNMTIKQLQEKIPEFDWKYYIITGMFGEVGNMSLNENETILVDDWDYLVNAAKLYSQIEKTQKRDFENLLVWLFVKGIVNYMPKYFQEARLNFDKVYYGNSVKPKRSLMCSNYVNDKLPDDVGRLYVKANFKDNSKQEATQMVKYLLNEFKLILNESDWMDAESKKVALDKADYIDIKIGYSDSILKESNETFQDDLNYGDDDFLGNHLKTILTRFQSYLHQLRIEQDPKDWISGPAVVNAFYSSLANQICFPAGILQPPFYNANLPKYMNYGGIGTVIGHEITHGFDDLGRKYDKNGVYHSEEDDIGLWTNKTVENYKEKVKCIIDQYNNYLVKQVNKTINGIITQGENIADNGGIKESFRAYKKWASENPREPSLPGLEKYTPEQMFFISFGQLWCGKSRDQALVQSILNDVHSPGEFRVIGSTSNSYEFAEAFKCKPEQKNNPTNKCSVW